MRGVLTCFGTREWRNRQTRWLQVPVPARAWGFNSPLAHANEMAPDLGFSSPGWGSFASEVLEKVLSLAEVGGEAGHGRPLHGRGDVGVDVHRCRDR